MKHDAVAQPMLYLDSNVFIDAYEGEPALSVPARSLLNDLEGRPGLAATSELTLAEVLARPEAERDVTGREAYLDLLLGSGIVRLVAITQDLLIGTARLRADHPTKLRLADSIHLGTAIQSGCRFFVSRDTRIRPPANIRRVEPDGRGVEAIMGGAP